MARQRAFIIRYGKHYLLLLPFFSLFTVFYLAPIVYGLLMSLTKWNGIQAPVYVGLENYAKVLLSEKFAKSMNNLARFVILVVPVGVAVSLALAIMLDRFAKGWASFFRGAFFLPVIIPLFLSSAIFRFILTSEVGLLNSGLALLGIDGPNWLSEPGAMIVAVAIVDLWRAIGFNFLLFYSGIKAIPTEFFEAATVDGANRGQQVFFITIPLLEPVIFLIVLNAFIGALQAFDIPWLLSNSQMVNYGGPQNGMLYPVMEIYYSAWGRQSFGTASAFAFILFLITMTITFAQFAWRKYRQGNEYRSS